MSQKNQTIQISETHQWQSPGWRNGLDRETVKVDWMVNTLPRVTWQSQILLWNAVCFSFQNVLIYQNSCPRWDLCFPSSWLQLHDAQSLLEDQRTANAHLEQLKTTFPKISHHWEQARTHNPKFLWEDLAYVLSQNVDPQDPQEFMQKIYDHYVKWDWITGSVVGSMISHGTLTRNVNKVTQAEHLCRDLLDIKDLMNDKRTPHDIKMNAKSGKGYNIRLGDAIAGVNEFVGVFCGKDKNSGCEIVQNLFSTPQSSIINPKGLEIGEFTGDANSIKFLQSLSILQQQTECFQCISLLKQATQELIGTFVDRFNTSSTQPESYLFVNGAIDVLKKRAKQFSSPITNAYPEDVQGRSIIPTPETVAAILLLSLNDVKLELKPRLANLIKPLAIRCKSRVQMLEEIYLDEFENTNQDYAVVGLWSNLKLRHLEDTRKILIQALTTRFFKTFGNLTLKTSISISHYRWLVKNWNEIANWDDCSRSFGGAYIRVITFLIQGYSGSSFRKLFQHINMIGNVSLTGMMMTSKRVDDFPRNAALIEPDSTKMVQGGLYEASCGVPGILVNLRAKLNFIKDFNNFGSFKSGLEEFVGTELLRTCLSVAKAHELGMVPHYVAIRDGHLEVIAKQRPVVNLNTMHSLRDFYVAYGNDVYREWAWYLYEKHEQYREVFNWEGQEFEYGRFLLVLADILAPPLPFKRETVLSPNGYYLPRCRASGRCC